MVKMKTKPKIYIDKEQFEKLCALQCTLIEFSCFFNCSEDTIENWCKETYNQRFSEVLRVKRGAGKLSLRRTQWKLAEKNPSMAIWLGKQYLNQREPEQEIEHNIGKIDPSFMEALNNSAKDVWKDDNEEES